MAEEPKDPKDQKSTKRRLRPSTETVRERTEKLQLQASKPKSQSKVASFFSGFFWPLRAFGRQIAKLGRFRIFRWIGYIVAPLYIRRSWRELKLVSWPGRRQTWQLTYAVIIFSVIFGLLVAVVDFGLDKLFKEFIVK